MDPRTGRTRDTRSPAAHRSAFTLIEMLVVVSLIVLLLALLLPTLHRTKELTRRSLCASNLHQIHSGFMSYAMDNTARLPETGRAGSGAGYWIETRLADHLVESYTGGYKVFYCPSALIDGFMTYPSLPALPTADWWWNQWPKEAGYNLHRVAGYGSNCHANAAMPDEYRIRRTGGDGSRILLHDGNELGPGGGVGVWSWRVAHTDAAGPEGNNRADLSGAVQWNNLDDFTLRWLNGSWQVWW